MKQVLRQGPDQENDREKSCAAWLIQNDYALGDWRPDSGGQSNAPLWVDWQGMTDKGLRYLKAHSFIGVIKHPASVAILCVLLSAFLAWQLS